MKRLFSGRDPQHSLILEAHRLFKVAYHWVHHCPRLLCPITIEYSQHFISLFCDAEKMATMNLLSIQDKASLKEIMKQTILLLPQHLSYQYFNMYFSKSNSVDHPFLGDLVSFRREIDAAWYRERCDVNLTGSLIHRHFEWDQEKKGRDCSP